MKILFLHGFTSSGQCEIAQTLRTEMEGMAEVIAPDLPLYPEEAITLVGKLCQEHRPQVIVGSSCGAFYAQMYARPQRKVILVNPFFRMSEFLEPRIGLRQYKSPRIDGKQGFEVTPNLIEHFKAIEERQFVSYMPENKPYVYGLFGKQDTLAHFRTIYDGLYTNAREFDGGHTMTAENVRRDLVPLIKEVAVYPQLIDVWAKSVKATHTFLSGEDFEYYKSQIPTYLSAVKLFVEYASDGTAIGFTGLSTDTIEMLFVSPNHFRKGIGRRLVALALSKGIHKVDVNEQNTETLRFYEVMGFKVVGRDENDGEGKSYPILHMEYGK